jgi:pyruvate/2-oxoglutarate dehydrogenase complex dihydrolipoamide dehydrogenase (E3) component
LIAIGGGTAGLVAAHAAAGLGARVALIEKARLGGDCLNTGCVPSKALLRSARAVRDIRAAGGVGVACGTASVDFAAVMSRMRARQTHLAHHDSEERLRAAGVDVYLGTALFTGAREISVGPTRLRFKRAVIATGGHPTAPPVPGLKDVAYLTNETIFDIDVLPKRLLVIGGGPIGCEMAQAFALFGSDVTVADVAGRPLPREDADASTIVQRQLESDGVRFRLGAPLPGVRRDDADAILVAAGPQLTSMVSISTQRACSTAPTALSSTSGCRRQTLECLRPVTSPHRTSSRTRRTRWPASSCRTRCSMDAAAPRRW